MTCNNCGNILSNGELFCPKCGRKVGEEPKSIQPKNNKTGLIIIIIVLCVLAICVAGYFLGKNMVIENNQINNTVTTTTNEEYTFNNFVPESIEIKPADENELTQKIEVKQIFYNPKYKSYGKYREAYVYGKNNNEAIVRLTLIIEYFDAAGKRLDKTAHNSYVYAGGEFIGELPYIKDDSQYQTAKITYTAEKLKSYELPIALDKIELTSNAASNNSITANIKNNNDKYGYFDVVCIYYKNSKPVFAGSRTYLKLEQGQSENIEFYAYKLMLNEDYQNPETIEFDDYKVFVQGAHYSDNETY